MVSTCPLISKSSRPFNNPLEIVPSPTTIIGIAVAFFFHIFFSSLASSRYLSLSYLTFDFTLWYATRQSPLFDRFPSFFFFFLTIWSSAIIIVDYLVFCRYYYNYYPYFTPCEFFIPTSDGVFDFTGVSVTECLLRSPGLFLVFRSIWAMQQSGWSRFFFSFLVHPVLFLVLWGPFQVH